MSKSTGNVVVPDEVIEKFGVDPLRFYLSMMIPVGRDGDFSWKRFESIYDSKLRNDLGNLLNRVLVLIQKEGGNLSDFDKDPGLLGSTWKDYEKHMNAYEIDGGANFAISVATRSNKLIDDTKPWALEGAKKAKVLSQLAEALRHTSLLLLPFIPETAQRIAKQLNVPYADKMLDRDFVIGDKREWGNQKDWKKIGKPEILFEPLG